MSVVHWLASSQNQMDNILHQIHRILSMQRFSYGLNLFCGPHFTWKLIYYENTHIYVLTNAHILKLRPPPFVLDPEWKVRQPLWNNYQPKYHTNISLGNTNILSCFLKYPRLEGIYVYISYHPPFCEPVGDVQGWCWRPSRI